ncbi:FAD-dependent oxidoreductase [Ceratobasidium sp. AG-Ba]|nr:FAD-dependent oxidoreductase [Ceratobasidium sp. AG-Ba]
MAKNIVIIGGGIIGTSTAYYLSKLSQDVKIHIVESVSIASAASGKAGGFLALDWHSNNTKSLAALSFKLHQELSDEHNGAEKWFYRRTDTLQIDIDVDRRTKAVPGADWLKSVSSISKLGGTTSTAQAHPRLMTQVLAEDARSRGVQIHIATATGLEFEPGPKTVTGVIVSKDDGETETIPATDVVFAAGPWTGALAKKLLGKDAGVAGRIVPSEPSSSLVLRPSPQYKITNHMLFTELSLPNGRTVEPEVYPRSDETVYICGAGNERDDTPLPERADQVLPNPEAIKRLKEAAEFLSPGTFTDAEVVAEQCCFRPNSHTGLPVIGKIRQGIWLASGHGVWGIHNGPGTGKCLAELILGLPTSADISKLAP